MKKLTATDALRISSMKKCPTRQIRWGRFTYSAGRPADYEEEPRETGQILRLSIFYGIAR